VQRPELRCDVKELEPKCELCGFCNDDVSGHAYRQMYVCPDCGMIHCEHCGAVVSFIHNSALDAGISEIISSWFKE